jgi:WD40 repeat protein
MLARTAGWLLLVLLAQPLVPAAHAAAPPARRFDRLGDDLPPGAVARIGTERFRHAAGIWAVAFSPDGRTIASGGEGGELHLWERRTGKELCRWRTGSPSIRAIAFSPDGRAVAAVLEESVVLYDPITARVLDRFGQHCPEPRALAFSRDGAHLAVGDGFKATWWDLTTGARLGELPGGMERVSSVAFAPNGKRLALAREKSIELWDLERREALSLFRDKGRSAVAFSPDGAMVVAADEEEGLRLWSVTSGQSRHLRGVGRNLLAVAFAPTGKAVASIEHEATHVLLTDIATGRTTRLAPARRGEVVHAFAFSPDGKTLATGGTDQRVRLWEVATGKEHDLGGERKGNVLVGGTADGKGVYVLGADGTLRLRERASGELVRRIGPRGAVKAPFAVSPDGALLATRERDGALVVRNASGKQLWADRAVKAGGRCLAFSPDSKVLACGDATLVELRRASTGRLVADGRFDHERMPRAIAFAPHGKLLATGGESGGLRVWDVPTGTLRKELLAHGELPITALAYSPDGKFLASGGADGFLCVWDTRTWRRVRRITKPIDRAAFVLFSPDGKLLASDAAGGAVALWDVATGALRATLVGHRQDVSSATFTRDGKFLVTGSADGTALVWHMASAPRSLRPASEAQATLFRPGSLPEGAIGRISRPSAQRLELMSAAISPDDKVIALLARENWRYRLFFLAAATFQEVRDPIDPGWSAHHVAFSPDGKVVAVSVEKEVLVWCARTGRKLHHFLGHPGGVSRFTFSRDSKAIAVMGWEQGEVRVWDLAADRPRHPPLVHERPVTSLQYPPDGKELVTACAGAVHYWDATTGRRLRLLKGPSTALTLSADGRVVAYEDGGRACWRNLANGKQFRAGVGEALAALSPDGSALITSQRIGRLGHDEHRLWGAANGKELCKWQALEPERIICFSRDGAKVLCASGWRFAQSLRWVGVESEVDGGARPSPDAVAWMTYAADGKSLICGAPDGSLCVRDGRNGKLLRRLAEKRPNLYALAVSPCGKSIATTDYHGTVLLLDARTGKQRHCLEKGPLGAKDFLTPGGVGLAFAPDGSSLIVAPPEGPLRIYDVSTGKRTGALLCDLSGREMTFSPDGTILAVAGQSPADELGRCAPALVFWGLTTGKKVGEIEPAQGELVAVAFSPDGKFVATGVARRHPWRGTLFDHAIILWEVATRKEALRIEGPGLVSALAFSLDGRALFSPGGKALSGRNNAVNVWDVATGKELGRLVGHRGEVHALALSSDGKVLASRCADGMVLIWDSWPKPWRPWRSPRLSPAQQSALWRDLGSPDAKLAHRAALQLGAAPDQAVALFREHVRPIARVDLRHLPRWIADLDSDDFEVRDKARIALETQGELAESALRRALAGRPSLEPRRRIEALLLRIEHLGADPEWLRGFRATTVLERIGSPAAMKLLAELARGAPEARLTREARASFQRLRRWPAAPFENQKGR